MRTARPCIRPFVRLQCRSRPSLKRPFHGSARRAVIKPFILADIGEGIKEVQIIQWFVEPEARVEQFDKLCEVQSDKAATEITSRFDGVIKKLYYEAEDMAQVGRPLCDIDIQSEISPKDEALTTPPAGQDGSSSSAQQPQKAAEEREGKAVNAGVADVKASGPSGSEKHSSLATPAVRGLLNELNINIADVAGTGKDGRVLKEDVHKFAAARDAPSPPRFQTPTSRPASTDDETQHHHTIPLTPTQTQMFKTMTRSLTIPHFLYADEINMTPLTQLRHRLRTHPTHPHKLSSLPFIIKAVSLALTSHPLLNARLDLPSTPSSHPQLTMRSNHNIGIAMDTPSGLLVPTIKHVASKSILDIAADLTRLQALARAGKLSAADLAGGTITVSNVGSLGGTYVAPVVVAGEVAVLGIGRTRPLPRFDDEGRVVRVEVGCFSWSADHRVVDGGAMARMAERVGGWWRSRGVGALVEVRVWGVSWWCGVDGRVGVWGLVWMV
ncbi:MAG: hypothetical protein FRX48_05470 [Lasallia pustulata]|uniref:Dihydrolipoamide acetyltransferase component of pyruvate dehydrogenase complex n=1 Tax=Lasallia pustulata TaxID=136370 RepID=A0A5M8PR61_9LECA|nr:MAG: hypothetical protein FRX48_05470 [Lasallia pustulata]